MAEKILSEGKGACQTFLLKKRFARGGIWKLEELHLHFGHLRKQNADKNCSCQELTNYRPPSVERKGMSI